MSWTDEIEHLYSKQTLFDNRYDTRKTSGYVCVWTKGAYMQHHQKCFFNQLCDSFGFRESTSKDNGPTNWIISIINLASVCVRKCVKFSYWICNVSKKHTLLQIFYCLQDNFFSCVITLWAKLGKTTRIMFCMSWIIEWNNQTT